MGDHEGHLQVWSGACHVELKGQELREALLEKLSYPPGVQKIMNESHILDMAVLCCWVSVLH